MIFFRKLKNEAKMWKDFALANMDVIREKDKQLDKYAKTILDERQRYMALQDEYVEVVRQLEELKHNERPDIIVTPYEIAFLNAQKEKNDAKDEEPLDIPVLDLSPENCKPVDICGNCMHLDFSGYCTCEHVSDKFKSPMEDASSCKFYSPYPKENKCLNMKKN